MELFVVSILGIAESNLGGIQLEWSAGIVPPSPGHNSQSSDNKPGLTAKRSGNGAVSLVSGAG